MEQPEQLGAMLLHINERPLNIVMMRNRYTLSLLLVGDAGGSPSKLCELHMRPEELAFALAALAEFRDILDKTPLFAERLSQLLPVIPRGRWKRLPPYYRAPPADVLLPWTNSVRHSCSLH